MVPSQRQGCRVRLVHRGGTESMEQVNSALKLLKDLCTSTRTFQQGDAALAIYRSPIIDYRHPDGYGQKGIAGLSKFLSHAETERDHVSGVRISQLHPRIMPHWPHLALRVWHSAERVDYQRTAYDRCLGRVSPSTMALGLHLTVSRMWQSRYSQSRCRGRRR